MLRLFECCQNCSGMAVSFLGLVWGFVVFSYLISVLVCVMWYQETAFCLLSYEEAAEKKTSFIIGVKAVID